MRSQLSGKTMGVWRPIRCSAERLPCGGLSALKVWSAVAACVLWMLPSYVSAQEAGAAAEPGSVPAQTGDVQEGAAESAPSSAQRQDRRRRGAREEAPGTLGLDRGLLEFDTPDFRLKLVKASQTIAALEPKGAGGFDFTPADQLPARDRDGFHHLGDLRFTVRQAGALDWQSFSTAAARRPVEALPVVAPALASADLTPTLDASCPLRIARTWLVEDGRLVLRFAIVNPTDAPIEIGSLGMPMVFNNMIHDFVSGRSRSLEDAHETCSFFDPYFGLDAGYLQVTRLNGHGPALVVAPDGRTPFEGWQTLEEPERPRQTFEGVFAWMPHTQADAETAWRGVVPWNPPTSATLAPGESRTYGVRFLVADWIRAIEDTLAAHGRPVAVGIPGYILPMDLDARLFLRYASPVERITVEPAGAIAMERNAPLPSGWQAWTLRGRQWGRARLLVTYGDGTRQSIHAYVIKPAAEAVADLGRFLFHDQWFEAEDDPFGRSPSVMSYDREQNRIVSQESRVWIAGLGDEGGSGSWVAAAMKLFGQPNREELARYERFIDEVLWGGLQYDEGDDRHGVRKSLFYYAPDDVAGFAYDPELNWGSWTSWDEREARSIGRGYNYPHVVAAYWAMYRLARTHTGLVANHPWVWYLDQAYETAMFMTSRRPDGRPRVGYVNWGLMEGTVFIRVLEDLQREGWTEKAAAYEARMKDRTERWVAQAYPFGSEMAWDSTGQEEVYGWCKYFGHDDKALVSLNAILGYMPGVPHWGYNGCARRYWDFLYAGKLRRIERQLHHYGSGLNAIPALTQYREQPDDYHLLRIGYGGMMGALSNIDQDGFASVAFHSFPSTLAWDAYTGDYGPNFFGHALETATYVIDHPDFGWVAFGGNLAVHDDRVTVEPRDSFRRRVYVAPRGLWITLDAGAFERVELDPATHAVRVALSPADPFTPEALLRIEQPAAIAGVGRYRPAQLFPDDRAAYRIPLGDSPTWIELLDRDG
jgi:hypothetical protein